MFRTTSIHRRLPFAGLAAAATDRKTFAAVLTIAAIALAGCSSSQAAPPSSAGSAPASAAGGPGSSGAAPGSAPVSINLTPQQNRITTPKVDAIANLVPAAIRERGTIIVTGSAGTAPPLRFYADDDSTIIGSEVDLAYLFSDVLGVKPEIQAADWAQNFVQIDSGKADVFISNVTVTEERKEKYDFATYRNDNLAFEAKKGSGLKITEPKDVAGKVIAVGSGTNQEKILVDWNAQNVKSGLPATDIKYFQNATDYYLALASGRIDAYLGPNRSAAFHVASTGDTEIVGTLSGAGDSLQGEIAVLSKKGSGLAQAYVAAINHTIVGGTYGQVLAKWGLSGEAVKQSKLNPPGLPKTD